MFCEVLLPAKMPGKLTGPVPCVHVGREPRRTFKKISGRFCTRTQHPSQASPSAGVFPKWLMSAPRQTHRWQSAAAARVTKRCQMQHMIDSYQSVCSLKSHEHAVCLELRATGL